MSLHDEDELLLAIGQELLGPSTERSFLNRQQIIAKAREWINQNNMQLRAIVCNHPYTIRQLDGQTTKEEDLAKALADALSAVYTYLPCATIAQYIIQKGLSNYCRH